LSRATPGVLVVRAHSVFDLLTTGNTTAPAVLFDLIEIDGKDLRSSLIQYRKGALADVLRRKRDGIVSQ
jgi:ATP-dependent DNA ligase